MKPELYVKKYAPHAKKVEQVEAWGNSMEYIENLVLNKLGLTKNQ